MYEKIVGVVVIKRFVIKSFLTFYMIVCGVAVNASDQPDFGINFSDRSEIFSDFVHQNTAPPVGDFGISGIGIIDYNMDGKLDVYMLNGTGHSNALLRNNGNGTFTDVTIEAGVGNDLGNSGVVVGDLNNDRCPDIFITGAGGAFFVSQSPTKLYQNNCDGTFSDVSDTANVPGDKTAMAAALADINNDGYLDIFIASPGHIDPSVSVGLPPGTFGFGESHPNKLYLNNGDMTFTDISESAGVDGALGACVASFSDVNQDGWQDIFVGNCNDYNTILRPWHLYINNGDLTFTDQAPGSGLDVGGYWMSSTPMDYNNDGCVDLYGTNPGDRIPETTDDPFVFADTVNGLFRSNCDGTYTDVATELGVELGTFGWGASSADFDNNGAPDLFVVGSIPLTGMVYPTPGRLFFNDLQDSFVEASAEQVSVDLTNRISSGLAHADFNGDGFEDLVVQIETFLNPLTGEVADPGEPVLMVNQGNSNNWLTVQPIGTESNSMAIGAKVEVMTLSGVQMQEVRSGSSFASSESPWPTFGLGNRQFVFVSVIWPRAGEPESNREFFGPFRNNKKVRVVEGRGIFRPK